MPHRGVAPPSDSPSSHPLSQFVATESAQAAAMLHLSRPPAQIALQAAYQPPTHPAPTAQQVDFRSVLSRQVHSATPRLPDRQVETCTTTGHPAVTLIIAGQALVPVSPRDNLSATSLAQQPVAAVLAVANLLLEHALHSVITPQAQPHKLNPADRALRSEDLMPLHTATLPA